MDLKLEDNQQCIVDFTCLDCRHKFASENIKLNVNTNSMSESLYNSDVELAGQSKLRWLIHAASQ